MSSNIVQRIFNDNDPIMVDSPCSMKENQLTSHGELFITENCYYFYGQVLANEIKKKIHKSEIKRLEKRDNLKQVFIMNMQDDQVTFNFKNYGSYTKSYETMLNVFNDNIPKRAVKVEKEDPVMSKELNNLIQNFTVAPKEVDIKEEIGRGNLGVVHRGVCRGKDVAIKKLINQDLKENDVKDLQQEVSKMGQMRHPNLALLMGGIFEKGQISLITELIDKNLAVVVPDSNVSMFKRIELAIEIAKGVNWLHESKPPLLHHNLKPENVLLNKELTSCKICDIGLGSIRSDEQGDNWISYIYKSPEALEKQKVDISSDVYSYGIIFGELLTKKKAFGPSDYPNLEQFKSAIKSGKRPDLSSLTDVPESIVKIISQCVSQNSSQRPTLATVIKQLEKSLTEFAIHDPRAKEFWNLCYSGQTVVKYKELESDLMDFLEVSHLETPELGKYLKLLIKQDKDNSEVVELEHFGKIWTWFGPLKEKNTTLIQIKDILTSGWYHGDLSAGEAENRLAKRPKGTYLVRLSATKPGNFTVSKMGKSGISHIRIKSKKGVLSCTVPSSKKKTTIKEEMPLHTFIKKISKPLELKKPCQGSPYVLANASCYEGDDSDDSDD